jgi:hypothetical protein
MRFEHVQALGQEVGSELVTAPHEIDGNWTRQPPVVVGDLPAVITPTGSNTLVSVVRNPTLIGTCNGSTMKNLKVTVDGKVYTVPSVYHDKLPRDADGRVYHNLHSGLWSLTLPSTGRLQDGRFTVRVEATRQKDNRILGQEYALIVSAVAFTNALTDPRPRQQGTKPQAQSRRKGKPMTQEDRKALIRKELLEKYDTDKDGKLSKDETAKMSNEDRRKNFMAMTDEEKAKAKAYMSMTPEQKAKAKAYQESKQGQNR